MVIKDKAFAGQLRACVHEAVAHRGQRLDAAAYSQRSLVMRGQGGVAYALMRLALLLTGQRY
ncbi:hypothetical protein RCH06_001973 [Polaromonas sp. CG_9.5]|uniref:hypothetical protein n=1 Tax=Polaromonas sp. CG_9.5 TaxID=3071705 RepID=UPI002E043E76|nr:hypothetical protein [Polaromonas sp. CG_9.5]